MSAFRCACSNGPCGVHVSEEGALCKSCDDGTCHHRMHSRYFTCPSCGNEIVGITCPACAFAKDTAAMPTLKGVARK